MTVAHEPVAERLLRSSARHSYDPEVDVDWCAPLADGLWFMQPERISLFGTSLWDGLSQEQRIELSRHEVSSMVQMGWWFEVLLMQGLLQEIYSADPRSARTQYALTEIADECRHSTMFGRLVERIGTPRYGPPPSVDRLARRFTRLVRGPSLYAGALLVEETLDRWQREGMADERVQPLTRMVARIHVLEEARHVTFARDELAKAMPRLNRVERRWHQHLTAQNAVMSMRSLVNPQVYAAVGIDPSEGRRTAMANPHYRETVAWMGEKVMGFLDEQGLVCRQDRRLWRASFLLRE